MAPKDHITDKHSVIYKINCADCDAIYVGQTGRNLSQRVKEHKSATDKGQVNNSGIAQHAWEQHHQIDWDHVEILAQESSDRRRQVSEALFIKQLAPSMNRDTGLDIPPVYNGIAQGRKNEISREHQSMRDVESQ